MFSACNLQVKKLNVSVSINSMQLNAIGVEFTDIQTQPCWSHKLLRVASEATAKSCDPSCSKSGYFYPVNKLLSSG